MVRIPQNIICVILLAFFLPAFSSAAKIDSLRRLVNGRNDTSNIKVLNALASELMDVSPDSVIYYCQKSIKSCDKINFNRGKAEALHYLGTAYRILGNTDEAVKNLALAVEEWKKAYPPYGGAKAVISQNNIGVTYYNLGNYPEAIENYGKALDIALAVKDTNKIAILYGNIALVHTFQGSYPKALENYLKALKIFEQSDNRKGLAYNYGNVGMVYWKQKQYEKALDYYNRALRISEEMGLDVLIASGYGNIGIVYMEQGDYQKALECYFKTLKIDEEIKNDRDKAISLGNIANVYQAMADKIKSSDSSDHKKEMYKKALEYYQKGLKINRDLKNIGGEATSLSNLGGLCLKMKKYTEASEFLEEGLRLSYQTGDKEIRILLYRNLSVRDSALKDFEGAVKNYKLYIISRDSISNIESSKKQTQLEMQYEFDKKQEADSIKTDKERKIAAVELKTEKNKQYSLYGGLCLVLVFSGFIFNRFRISQKQKKIIEEQKLLVEEQKQIVEEKNKDVLDSIRYAKRIQRSLLPTEKYIDKVLRSERKD